MCELLAHLSIHLRVLLQATISWCQTCLKRGTNVPAPCCSFVVWRALGQHEARHQEQLPTASMRGAQLPPSTAAATGSLHSGAPRAFQQPAGHVGMAAFRCSALAPRLSMCI